MFNQSLQAPSVKRRMIDWPSMRCIYNGLDYLGGIDESCTVDERAHYDAKTSLSRKWGDIEAMLAETKTTFNRLLAEMATH